MVLNYSTNFLLKRTFIHDIYQCFLRSFYVLYIDDEKQGLLFVEVNDIKKSKIKIKRTYIYGFNIF